MTSLESKQSPVAYTQRAPSSVLAQQLEGERVRWEAAFGRAPHGMALVDQEGVVFAANAALCRMLGRSEAEVCGEELRLLTHPHDRAAGLREMCRAIDGEIDSFELQERYLRPDEEVRWVRLTATVVRPIDGAPVYFLVHLDDISARKVAESQLVDYAAQLQELARQDPLTGLCNYRAFHRRLEEEVGVACRKQSDLGMILFDVDDFRQLSRRDDRDGDEMLEQVAHVIKRTSRTTDISARIGPDEFALVLPGTGARGARAIAERIADEVEQLGSVSISFGVAAWAGDLSPIALVLSADAELRASKRRLPAGGARTGRLTEAAANSFENIGRLLSAAGRAVQADAVYLTRCEDGGECVWVASGDAPAPFTSLSEAAPSSVAGANHVRIPLRRRDGQTVGAVHAELAKPVAETYQVHLDLLRSIADVIVEKFDSEIADATAQREREEIIGMSALVSALSARDHYTGEHSKTVVRLAVAVARQMGLPEKVVRQVEQVALLHDIGKVGIPDSILQKDGPLTSSEWELMREHPAIGARILAGTRTLTHLAPAVHAEHERFDGSGYPNGLRGAAIPLASRITLACDAYDAMTTDRPYRSALGSVRAVQELRSGAGTQFDPAVVTALLEVIRPTRQLRGASRDRSSIPSPA